MKGMRKIAIGVKIFNWQLESFRRPLVARRSRLCVRSASDFHDADRGPAIRATPRRMSSIAYPVARARPSRPRIRLRAERPRLGRPNARHRASALRAAPRVGGPVSAGRRSGVSPNPQIEKSPRRPEAARRQGPRRRHCPGCGTPARSSCRDSPIAPPCAARSPSARPSPRGRGRRSGPRGRPPATSSP